MLNRTARTRSTFALLLAMTLLTALASACNEKKDPNSYDVCETSPEDC